MLAGMPRQCSSLFMATTTQALYVDLLALGVYDDAVNAAMSPPARGLGGSTALVLDGRTAEQVRSSSDAGSGRRGWGPLTARAVGGPHGRAPNLSPC